MQRLRARDLRPVNLYRTVKANLDTPFTKPGGRSHERVQPPWFKAMEKIPPSEILTRTIPVQHQPQNRKARKPRNIYRPQQIVYEEDELRKRFYKDHPWELARPRVVLEVDGKDAWFCDWSTGLEQPGMPLCGESVVQRQLWMMHNIKDMTKDKAYDLTRREFYALRQEEEVEQRIAQEEAMMVGAYFGKNRLQIGMVLEDKEYERWKGWATTELAKIEAQREAAYTSFGPDKGEEDINEATMEAKVEEFVENAPAS